MTEHQHISQLHDQGLAFLGYFNPFVTDEFDEWTEALDGDSSILQVTIAAKEGESIPQGILADLRFKISEEVPADDTTVPLINQVSAWSDEIPPNPIESITGEDGAVTISANPPVFACFFYMH